MNNKTLTILTLALAFLGGFLFFYRGGPIKQVVPVANQINQQTTTKQIWETKTEEQASVTVVITPNNTKSEIRGIKNFRHWRCCQKFYLATLI